MPPKISSKKPAVKNTGKSQRPDLTKALMTSSQIADLMGMSQPVISNYKKRDVTFPKPAFASGNVTLYWRDEVEHWINSKKRNRQERANILEARAQELMQIAQRLRNK